MFTDAEIVAGKALLVTQGAGVVGGVATLASGVLVLCDGDSAATVTGDDKTVAAGVDAAEAGADTAIAMGVIDTGAIDVIVDGVTGGVVCTAVEGVVVKFAAVETSGKDGTDGAAVANTESVV